MQKFNTLFFFLSILLMVVSYNNRNEFPVELGVGGQSLVDPLQIPVSKAPFSTIVDKIKYEVKPLFSYEISGVVVSVKKHGIGSYLHKLSNDKLNIADLCVVWGKNTQGLDLNNFSFRSGQFTCFFQTDHPESWRQFNKSQLSNNHLLTDNDEIRASISDVRIGDEIHLSGWLAQYKNQTGFSRGTSTTRLDTGNGACETIFLTDFDIVSSMDNPWRTYLQFSFGMMFVSIFLGYRSIKNSMRYKPSRKSMR